MRQRLTGCISALRSKKLFGNGARTRRGGRATVEGLEDRRLLSVVAGPDGGGYYAHSGPMLPIDLAEGDANVRVITGLTGQDDFAASVNLGANSFKLYGVEYTGASLYVGTNGLITFGAGNVEYRNDTLSAGVPQAAVAPLWDDWLINDAESRVLYQFSGNRLIVEWNMIQNWNTGPSLVTFQAILELNTSGRAGDITFNYVGLDTENPDTANGASATVGIKGAGATTERLVVSFSDAPLTPNQAKPAVATGSSIRVSKNRPPVLTPLDAAFVPEGGTVALSASATDPDGDTLAYQWDLDGDGVFETAGREANFTAAGLDGPGAQQIAVRVDDGHGHVVTAAGSVTLTNAAPVANDDTATVAEDGDLLGNVLANDGDAGNTGTDNSERLLAELVQGPARGQVLLSSDGSYEYQPQLNYFGADSFTYRVSDKDGGVSRTATVNITVTPVNDAPVAVDDSAATDEDVALTIVPAQLLANDSDVDGDTLSLERVDGPTHGTLGQNEDGTIRYTPHANYHGADRITYVVRDGNGGEAVSSLTLTVRPVNDAPVAADDAASTDEDRTLSGSVLGNDTDPDWPAGASGDGGTPSGEPGTTAAPGALVAVLVGEPSNGSLTLRPDGSYSYTPDADFFGTDSFTYRVEDAEGATSGTATVTITVAEANDAPVAADDAATVEEDGAVGGDVLSNDRDPDNADGLAGNDDELFAQVVSGPSHGTLVLNRDGSFTYTPAAKYYGTDAFTYRAVDCDGAAAVEAATVTLTVVDRPDAPVARAEAVSTTQDKPVGGNVLTNDTDFEPNDGLAAALVDGARFGTVSLAADGNFNYRPNTGFFGTDRFTYQATDGGGVSEVTTVTVTVGAAAAGSIYLVPDALSPGRTALVINGTAAADNVHVAPASGGLEVFVSGASRGVYAPSGRIVIFGYGGNDTLRVSGSVHLAAWVYGDQGSDTVKLGSGGGIAFGGAGADHLNGGWSRDMLVGGDGGDRLIGNPGDDILVAALTSYDDRFSQGAHELAWRGLRAEWTSGRSYLNRVNNLRGGSTATAERSNGSFFLNHSTLIEDGSADQIDVLSGASGEDWFVYNQTEDRVTDLASSDDAGDDD